MSAPHQYFRNTDVQECRRRIKAAGERDLRDLCAALDRELASRRPRKRLTRALRSRIDALSIPSRS